MISNKDNYIKYSKKLGGENIADLIERYGTIPPRDYNELLAELEKANISKNELTEKLYNYSSKINSLTGRIIVIILISFLLIFFSSVIFYNVGKGRGNDIVGQRVYTTSSGKKYHLYDCSYISNNYIKYITIKDAQKKGYTPCHNCRPDRLLK